MFNLLLITRRVFRLDELGQEILKIAVPAALALAADPLASLVDTAFIGRLGSEFLIFFVFLFSLPPLMDIPAFPSPINYLIE